jgi:hypothetical protein
MAPRLYVLFSFALAVCACESSGSMTVARDSHTATLLGNGDVLIAGGNTVDGPFASAEVFDSTTGISTATGSMTASRWNSTATLLPTGQVLMAGGADGSGRSLASAELYQ